MKFRKKPIVIEAEQWFPGKVIKGGFTRLKNLGIDIDIDMISLDGFFVTCSEEEYCIDCKNELVDCVCMEVEDERKNE